MGAATAAQTASLQKTANLSDLGSASTARTNLGVADVVHTTGSTIHYVPIADGSGGYAWGPQTGSGGSGSAPGVMVANSNSAFDGVLVAWAGNASVGDVQFCSWDAPLRAGAGTPRALFAHNGTINSKFQGMNLYGGYDGVLDGFYDGVYPPKYSVNNEYYGNGNANLQARTPFRFNSTDIQNVTIRRFSAEAGAQGQAGLVSMGPWSLVTTALNIIEPWSGDTNSNPPTAGGYGGTIVDTGPCGVGGQINIERASFTTPFGAALGVGATTSGSNVLTAANGSFVVGPRVLTFPGFGFNDLFPEGSVIGEVTGSVGNQSVSLFLPICEGDVTAGSTTVRNLLGEPFPFVGDALYNCLNFNGVSAVTDGTTIVSEAFGPEMLTLSAPANVSAQGVTFYVKANALLTETNVVMRGGSHVRVGAASTVRSSASYYYCGYDVTVFQTQAGGSLILDGDTYPAVDQGRLLDGNFSVVEAINDSGLNYTPYPLRGGVANSVPFQPAAIAGLPTERWGIGGTTGPVMPGIPTVLFDDVGRILLTPTAGEEVIVRVPQSVGTATLGVALGTADSPGAESGTLVNGNGTFTIGQAITAPCLFDGTTITNVTGSNPNKVITLSQPTSRFGVGFNIVELSTTAVITSGTFAVGMTIFGSGLPPLGVTITALNTPSAGDMTLSQAVGFDGLSIFYELVTSIRLNENGFGLGGRAPSPPVTITGSTGDNATLQLISALGTIGIVNNELVQPPSAFDNGVLAWLTTYGGAYWWQGEVSGSLAHDLGAGAHDATLTGGFTFGNGGIGDLTTAIAYDGTSGCAIVPVSGSLVNECVDPSFEGDTTGSAPTSTSWAPSGGGIVTGGVPTVINTDHHGQGSKCLQMACSAQFQGESYQLAMTVGQAYTITVWAKGASGGEIVFIGLKDTGGAVWGEATPGSGGQVTLTTSWQPFTMNVTPTSTAQATGLLITANEVPGAATYFLDTIGILPPGQTYFDGDTTGGGTSWSGTHSNSTSLFNKSALLQPTGAFTAFFMGNPTTTTASGMFGIANMDTGLDHGFALGGSPGSVAGYLSSAGHRLDNVISGPLTAGTYQMLAMTYDGTSTLTIFKDGVVVGTPNTGAHAPDYSSSTMTLGQVGGAQFWPGRCPKAALITGVALAASDLAALLALI